jgi:hypothetical protein
MARAISGGTTDRVTKQLVTPTFVSLSMSMSFSRFYRMMAVVGSSPTETAAMESGDPNV